MSVRFVRGADHFFLDSEQTVADVARTFASAL